jgi:hypothetical protein
MSVDGINRSDWGPGGEHRQLVPGAPTSNQVSTETRHRDWAGVRLDDNRQSLPAPADGGPQLLLQGVDWKNDPAGEDFRRGVAREAVSVFDDLEQADLDAAAQAFCGLPSQAQGAVFQELGLGPPTRVRPIDQGRVDAFMASDDGLVLANHWRGRTTEKLAIIDARMKHIVNGYGDLPPLSAATKAALLAWYEGLSFKGKIACHIVLAGR